MKVVLLLLITLTTGTLIAVDEAEEKEDTASFQICLAAFKSLG